MAEDEIERLEQEFPLKAEQAFAAAPSPQAKARKVLKKIAPPVKEKPGKVTLLQ